MHLNNYTSPVRIWQQSVPHGVNMYFKILLFKKYYWSALYEIGGQGHLC